MEALLREAKQKSTDIPPSLKEQIVLEHTPLIRYIVNRIAVRLPSHIDLDDLHNTGVIGLMDAIEKYDPEKNCKFKTYAEFRIKGAILDQLRSLDWVPRSVRQKSRRLERAYGEVEQRLGRIGERRRGRRLAGAPDRQVPRASQPGAGHLAGQSGRDPRHQLRRRSCGHLRRHRRGRELREPLRLPQAHRDEEVIADTIGTLPEKERLVVSLYYYEDLNMKEIGGILGITESRVCQIHTKSVLRLRAKLKGMLDRSSSQRRLRSPGRRPDSARRASGARSVLLAADQRHRDVVLAAAGVREIDEALAGDVEVGSPRQPRAISSSWTWPVRPSEQSTKTSSTAGVSSARSASTERRTPSARVRTWRCGCPRAACAVISLRRTSSATSE